MKRLSTLLSVSMLLLATHSAVAQYSGPGASPVFTNVTDVIASAKDDSLVELDGYIIKQLTKDKFLFSDGKAQIRVEIDQEIFPRQAINERTRVRIRGEVEKDFLESPEIDVSSVEVVN